jgi:hypothetical protein
MFVMLNHLVETLKTIKPSLNSILLDFWTMIKNQGLSFILIGVFAIYQIKINMEQSFNINMLQNELLNYLRNDRVTLIKTLDKNTDLLEQNKVILERLQKGANK